MNKLLIGAIIFAAAALSGWFLFFDQDKKEPSITNTNFPGFQQSPSTSLGASPSSTAKPSSTPTSSSSVILLNVPFAAQAPFGDWADQRQQDGCEEASALMAMYWVQGKSLTPAIAEKEILAISDWEEKTYGSYHDTSAEDTNKRILQGYFHYTKAEVRHNISLEDIKTELRKGNALITPMDGRALGNPNFTAPGPERHMLVIRGYDPAKKEIITNDPGTRNGKLYRYNENVFFSAIRDYETGYHEPITPGKKAMIVIKPS